MKTNGSPPRIVEDSLVQGIRYANSEWLAPNAVGGCCANKVGSRIPYKPFPFIIINLINCIKKHICIFLVKIH